MSVFPEKVEGRKTGRGVNQATGRCAGHEGYEHTYGRKETKRVKALSEKLGNEERYSLWLMV